MYDFLFSTQKKFIQWQSVGFTAILNPDFHCMEKKKGIFKISSFVLE